MACLDINLGVNSSGVTWPVDRPLGDGNMVLVSVPTVGKVMGQSCGAYYGYYSIWSRAAIAISPCHTSTSLKSSKTSDP